MSVNKQKNISYKDAGVDIDVGDEFVERIRPAVASTMRPEVLAGVGGFASLVNLPVGFSEPVLVSGTDGVGTKLKLAFAADDHRGVGVDLVAMCVNDVLATGAQPLFFLDYFACSRLDPTVAVQVVEGIANGCRQAGCALVGGETAELPGFYQPEEYDLAGFAVGVVERSRIIDGSKVGLGDAVLGLASSGVHSNGFSLVRAVLARAQAALTDELPGSRETIGTALLKPTIIYVKPVHALMNQVEVRAIAHITGGGLPGNIPRTIPEGLGVRLTAGWPVPPIFRWLAEAGPVATAEMLRTFNLGIGMTLVVPRPDVERALAILADEGVAAHHVGEVVAAPDPDNRVFIEGQVL